MNFVVTVAALSLSLVTLAAAEPDLPSAKQKQGSETRSSHRPDVTAASLNSEGIGLTASHKQIIYDAIANEQEQTISGDPQLAVGNTVPDVVTLNTMPIEVKDKIGLLKDYKFVKLPTDKILIVDPTSRKIMDIISKQEAGK